MITRSLVTFLACLLVFVGQIGHAQTSAPEGIATIDLRDKAWGQEKSFPLDAHWDSFWNQLLSPDQLDEGQPVAQPYPVPEVWGEKSEQNDAPPALGALTYRVRVLVPAKISRYYLYLPDMPSAYVLWANKQLLAKNGVVGFGQRLEHPGFGPKTVFIDDVNGQIDLVLQVSNYHYREGGIWFSLKLTDESGHFALAQKPLIWAVFFGAILIALGLYNLSMFVFRSQEQAALYFGMLCLTVGLRRLLIDERVIYLFDWFSWESLQKLEHLCFYLTLPLFMGFFVSLYHQYVAKWTMRVSWILISPFVFLCIAFPTRVFTELNVSFQVLVMISVCYTLVMYFRALSAGAENTRAFGFGLLVLAITVSHDILKANGFFNTPNIAHFGVLAFVITQSFSLQKRYLDSLGAVERMSRTLQTRNQELIELDEFKDEFLATTSHELRTPLQGISGLARVLKENAPGTLTHDQQDKVELIANTSQRLSVLVNDILDFSSIKHGKLVLKRGPVDLHEAAELSLATVRPMLGIKDVELRADIADSARYIDADTFRLQQVLVNLLGNAVKYTEKGEIVLSSKLRKNELVLEVRDTGLGIPDEKRDTLFAPFEQVHVEGHFTAAGTGLGLSISRKLVELHGGKLELHSQLGQGTSVCLAFPQSILVEKLESDPDKAPKALASTEAGDTQKISASVIPSSQSENARIFVVDDEALNCEFVASFLKTHGFKVEVFQDGMSVLKRLTEIRPDLILLDYMMPQMDGIEVCRVIRQTHDSYELPVMMLTARHQIADVVSAFNAGANDYLVKPYHDKELLARVNAQLSVRGCWLASQENERLKSEIKRRIELEEQLSETNDQLLSALDISSDLILMVDESLSILYANKATREHFNEPSQGLSGHPFKDYFDGNLFDTVQSHVQQKIQSPLNEVSVQMDNTKHYTLSIKAVSEQGQQFYIILLAAQASEAGEQELKPFKDLSSELYASRKRIEEIEDTLRKVMHVSEELQHDTPSELETDASPLNGNHKEALSQLLRQSLNLWEKYTGKSKVDLAELSRCWRVYVDGTTVKTRTFDKYLSAKTVPDRARWRAVVRTAHYVHANCALSEEDAKDIAYRTREIEAFYS